VTYELLLRGRAKADIRRAAKWYERQREGLGRDFVAEVDAAIALIETNPEQYEIVHREIRHAILRRFPYGVFYRIPDH
jgi:plasmid stabilization system protein ParE